jgi:hypothetical protein
MKTSSRDKKSKPAKTGAKPSVKTEKAAVLVAEAIAEKPQKADKKPADKFRKLFLWNVWLAALHGVQGIAVVLLSTTKAFPVTTDFLSQDQLASSLADKPVLATASEHLFDLNLAALIAAFFFMSAIAHLLVATACRKRYENNLTRGINRARWIEYSFSASTMMVAIGLLTGITDFGTLLMLFALTAVMNLCGWAMELYNQKAASVNWLAYIIGCVAGIVPWIVISLALLGSSVWGNASAPTFVYWIYGTMFVLFASFAVNMFLQYKKVGKWADYLYGEHMYMVLSLVAKTALAWQIFAGALRP